MQAPHYNSNRPAPTLSLKKLSFIPLIIFLIIFLSRFSPFTTVPAGHVGVTELFGKVDQQELGEGFHIINPLKKVHRIDCRNKQLTLEDVKVPSQDQLTTKVDITVKWRVDRSGAAKAYSETGNAAELASTHLVPAFRSLIREAGKGVLKAEDFYRDNIQTDMQQKIYTGLQRIKNKGIIIDEVLMRKVELPPAVTEGVLEKKRREQLAEQQKAEFDRFKTEQQQKIAQAEAERNAAVEEAEKRKALADAKAYEITAEAKARAEAIKIEGLALKENTEVIKLRAIEKWNGTVPQVSLSDNAIPLIDLGNLPKK